MTVLLMAVILDVMISFGLCKTDCYRYQTFSDIYKGNMNCDVLYMGNSRGFSHFNPRIIDSICGVNSYSLGLGGYPINTQIAAYHCYKACGFRDIVPTKTESYKILGEEWKCREMVLEEYKK